MGLVIGFIIGYILGSQTGPLNLDEISQAWGDIKQSEEAQDLVSGGANMVLQMLQQTIGAFMGQAAARR
jgi:hypothetical protein